MFKFILSTLLAISISLPASAMSGDEGQFFFRYKSGLGKQAEAPIDDWASKTIHARYIGGVDILFSELLPLKPEWEDDNWQVDVGTLPSGITFNAATRTFEGRPDAVQSGVNVILYGYDTNGVKVAKADVTFDIRELPANSVKVDLYAHTGKFFNNTIDLPAGVTITRWVETELPPGGVDYNGRYVEGTPVAKGQWPILNLGYEYGNDTAVFAYYGTITVEDGPQFNKIADQLKMVGGQYLAAIWDQWKVPGIVRPVGDPKMVRYYVERAPGEVFPGSVRATGDDFNRTISGSVRNYYAQAKIRIKAIDSDGAEGYSNWFQFGTLGPNGVCLPSKTPTIALGGVVDKPFYKTGYPINTANDASKKLFTVISGTLPNNLVLDKDTGIISGTPRKQEQQLGIKIGITFPDNPVGQQVVCGPYDITVAPSAITLDASGNMNDYRVGSSLAIKLTPAGGLLPPYTVTMDEDAVLPDTVTFDPTTGMLSGPLNKAGVYTANFTLLNGNGVPEYASVSFEVHDPLKIDPIQSRYSIARLDSKSLFSYTFDTKAVIGQALWDITGGSLPEGIRLGSLSVQGGTVLPEGSYGPYKIRLTDATGSSTSTDEFWIDVTPREPLVKNPAVPATFGVNAYGTIQPFSVTQAPLAQKLYKLEYELQKVNDLPQGLVFDEQTGVISGTPLKKETVDNFAVLITEQSPERLTATSDSFSVVVADPAPIGDLVKDAQVSGNKNGVSIKSRDLKSLITDAKNRIVGGVDAVKFLSYSPQIAGVTLNQTTNVLEGIPTEEYSGLVKVDFVDGANRPGSVSFWVKIYPYPELASEAKYDLPRLANASQYNIEFKPNGGFYKTITWSLSAASDPLPNGLTFAGGKISGSTDAPEGTIRNIEVEAINDPNGIKITKSIIIEVKKRIAAEFKFPTDPVKIYINEATGAVDTPYSMVASGYLTGSTVSPVVYSFGPDPAPSWASINPGTGAITGTPPTLGDWPIGVIATDKENVQTLGTAPLRATLSGSPNMTPGDQNKTVRINETFKTDEQTVANVVRPFTWKTDAAMPSTFTLDPIKGTVEGGYDQQGSKNFTVNIEDTHKRKFSPAYTFRFDVKRPLQFSTSPTAVVSVPGTQYSAANPLSVTFDEPVFKIDEIEYRVVGDIPGTPYVKTLDPASGLARYTRYDNQGNIVDVTDQQSGESVAQAEYRLQPDHLIFDSQTLVFSGIPSKAGTFNMTLKAWDTHGNKYYKPSDSTRLDYNAAEKDFSVSVLPAIGMTVQNSADGESLYQYTSQPTLRSTVSDEAYGRGVTWQKVSGNLPANVRSNEGSTVLSYSGYPQAQGDFGNIVWKAVDLAGRSVNTGPVAFHVGPRQAFELASTRQSPVQLVVFTEDAGTKVTAKNAAYGPSIGVSNWVLTGQANLPPGVTATIVADGVKFEGTSNKLGVYTGIQVRGTDPLGATAVYDLTFQVVASPFPIILNVYNIKTRVGYPIAMEPPFASKVLSTDNTYGSLRFYSNDLPQDIVLDKDTGIVAGVIDEAQKLSFDVYVTDDTQRVTSEAVEVDVMPNLRVIVPSEIRVEPAMVMNQPIATDYRMGKVQYTKGAGNWPANFDVDPDDGHIYSKTSGGKVTANMGTYTGLTIVATDTLVTPTFGTLVDTQTSNPFTINIATAGSYLELRPAVMPDAEKRIAAYSFDFKSSLFRQNVDESELVWALVSSGTNGWKIPPGLSINTNGVLSGTPTTEGTYTFQVKATKRNQAAITTTQLYTLVVKLPQITLELDDHVFANVKRDDSFTFDMTSLISSHNNIEIGDIRFTKTTATGSNATYGVSMNTYGVFSGNWTTLGTYTFDVEARFTNGNESIKSKKTYSVTVKGNSYSFKRIAAGGYHTCGITTDDELSCWGSGGRTGIDSSVKKLPTPVNIGPVQDVSTGISHSCAIRQNGQLVCFGYQPYGQLGNGSEVTSYTPVAVSLPGPVTKVVAGRSHTCAVVSGTDLYCWGLNTNGQLGNGNKVNSSTPVFAVNDPQGIVSLTLGANTTCYARTNGAARCVGINNYGQLGTGNSIYAQNWVDMTVMSGIAKIAMDSTTTCVLTNSGSVQCIGLNGDDYKFGNGTTTSSKTPKVPTGLGSNVKDMDFNEGSGCASMNSGETLCWGLGDDGKMGDGTPGANRVPAPATTANMYKSLSVGNLHVCGVTQSGAAECWGNNNSYQLGNGSQTTKYVPTLVE